MKVLGILKRQNEYLVERIVDPSGTPFYRPIGGGVEFGEASGAALVREFQEELGVGITVTGAVGTIENRFEWDEEPQHELIVLQHAEFDDDSLYERSQFSVREEDGSEREATWRTLDELRSSPEPLYPEEIAGLLRGRTGVGGGHVESS
jgi:ADP-ribose pyrophosphatase YjhB (NUDIX family)